MRLPSFPSQCSGSLKAAGCFARLGNAMRYVAILDQLLITDGYVAFQDNVVQHHSCNLKVLLFWINLSQLMEVLLLRGLLCASITAA